jgi:hypothetical protein
MRLRLFDRIRRLVHPRRSEAAGPQGKHRRDQRDVSESGVPPGRPGSRGPDQPSGTLTRPATSEPDRWPIPGGPLPPGASPGLAHTHRASGPPEVRVGGARARVGEASNEAAAARAAPVSRADWHEVGPPADLAREVAAPDARAAALTRAAAGIPAQDSRRRSWREGLRASLPFATPHAQGQPWSADGRRHCGSLEAILWRQWDAMVLPPAEIVEAVDRLAELPERIKEKLAAGLDAIFVGPGGVPELDEMTALRGVPLPSGQASWDACAGAYGDRKVVVGSRPSPTPDVVCHEVGHALDDLDSPPGKWQSDSAEFRILYEQCEPHLASDFHRQPGGLGRKEFFADAFAAIASGQRPALVDMLSGDTRTALRVMLYFNRRYGI